MGAGKLEPLVSNLPMERWTQLTLPMAPDVQDLVAVRMPYLEEIFTDIGTLRSLPYADLKNLQRLQVLGAQFTYLDLYRMPALTYCLASDNYQLKTVDATGCSNVTELDFSYCSKLNTLIVTGCTSLQSLYGYGCAFPQATVDQILADLVAGGQVMGFCRLNGGSSAPPSDPDGLAHKNTLIGRGWTVSTN